MYGSSVKFYGFARDLYPILYLHKFFEKPVKFPYLISTINISFRWLFIKRKRYQMS